MEFKITNKNGATLKTANKYVREDIAITIDESLLGSGGSCEPTGLPIEVDSLPSGGTAVPNSGYVEKVYVNTSMSVEELVSILSQLTYTNSAWVPMPVYGVLNGASSGSIMLCIFKFDDLNYAIMDFNSSIVYFSTMIMPDSPFTFVGWNTEFNGEIVVNDNVNNQLQDVTVGAENDKLTNLFSSTPFGGSAGVEGAIYKIPSKIIDLFIAFDKGFGPLSETYNVVGCEEVEALPTSNIISSTMESFYFYYNKSANDIYVYINIGNGDMWVNAGTLIQQAIGVSLTFKGTGVYKGDFVENGYYAQYSGDKYYICLNGKFVKIENEQKTVEKFINEERFDRLEINCVDNDSSPLRFKFEDFKGDYIKINIIPYSFMDGNFDLGSCAFASTEAKTIYLNALCEGTLRLSSDAFYYSTKLEKLVLNFTDFQENESVNLVTFSGTPIANGTGYIYVPDNKVDYVKSLKDYSAYASQIRPLSAYTE